MVGWTQGLTFLLLALCASPLPHLPTQRLICEALPELGSLMPSQDKTMTRCSISQARETPPIYYKHFLPGPSLLNEVAAATAKTRSVCPTDCDKIPTPRQVTQVFGRPQGGHLPVWRTTALTGPGPDFLVWMTSVPQNRTCRR